MPLFPSNCTIIITVLSLHGEYVVRFFLPDGVFLPFDHGLDFFYISYVVVVVVVVVVFTLKAVPISTQYFLTSVLVQLTRTPSVVTG